MLVLLLTGFLSIILMRVLKNDFMRYAQGDAEEEDDEEETQPTSFAAPTICRW